MVHPFASPPEDDAYLSASSPVVILPVRYGPFMRLGESECYRARARKLPYLGPAAFTSSSTCASNRRKFSLNIDASCVAAAS